MPEKFKDVGLVPMTSCHIDGDVGEQKVNRILIDDGSVINILPLNTIKELGVFLDELS